MTQPPDLWSAAHMVEASFDMAAPDLESFTYHYGWCCAGCCAWFQRADVAAAHDCRPGRRIATSLRRKVEVP